MRKIAAQYIYTGEGEPLKRGIISLSDDGTVLDVKDTGGTFREEAGLEFYNGVIVPGFVNAHCHLELSHLKQLTAGDTGLPGFIKNINEQRFAEEEEIIQEAQRADRMMERAGIVAVGDISNKASTLEIKKRSHLYYHTFIELFGFHPARADHAYQHGVDIEKQFLENNLTAGLTPHSPYSVSDDLFQHIATHHGKHAGILTMHNQETDSENELFRSKTGGLVDHLEKNIGLDISFWSPTGNSSIQSVLNKMPTELPLILVHNTFTTQEDIDFILENRNSKEIYFCLCPNSNLFIENALPDFDLFVRNQVNVCLGTDSLASNHQLSILEEMKTIQSNSDISLQTLVDWACKNGADALNVSDRLGTISPGKKPGINLISKINYDNNTLTSQSEVKKMV